MKSFNQACLNKVCGVNENEFPSVDMVAVVIFSISCPSCSVTVFQLLLRLFRLFRLFPTLQFQTMCLYLEEAEWAAKTIFL